jgi:hypothetical protein
MASKVYGVLSEKCEDYQGKLHDDWCEYMEGFGIQVRDYDHADDAADDLMEFANDGNFSHMPIDGREHIVCYDPFSSVVDHIGGFQFLMIPKEVADKIVVLNGMP